MLLLHRVATFSALLCVKGYRTFVASAPSWSRLGKRTRRIQILDRAARASKRSADELRLFRNGRVQPVRCFELSSGSGSITRLTQRQTQIVVRGGIVWFVAYGLFEYRFCIR